MSALVEVHNRRELDVAVAAGALDWPLVVLAGVGVAIVRHRRA